MSKPLKISIVALVVIGIGVLLYFLIPGENKDDKKDDELTEKKKDEIELVKQIKDQKRNSEGGYLLYELLKDYKNTVSLKTIQDPISTSLKSYKTDYPTVYFLLDRNMSISYDDADVLYDFVNEGNSAFISVEDLNENFYNTFFSGYPYIGFWDTVFKLNFYHEDLKLTKNYPLKIKRNGLVGREKWNYIETDDSYYYDDMVIISTDKEYERPIFIKFKVGDGWIYLHSVPQAFYNASMFTEEGLEYAESVFSNLPKGHYLWHEHSKKWNPNNDYEDMSGGDNINRDSPLKYILANRSLSWAYFTLLISLLLYIIFKTKRKQRVIPAIQPNHNNSLDFVNTVSKLYLRQNKHNKFIKHYEQSFVHYIRDKYYINPTKIDQQYIKQVSLKSEIGEDKIEVIFDHLSQAKIAYNFSSNDLIALHKEIEYFYKNCK